MAAMVLTQPPAGTKGSPKMNGADAASDSALPSDAEEADKLEGLRDWHALRRLNLNHLRYFVAVAEELHFGRAARRLGISQPPLSLHIKALEQQIGAQLFTRIYRKIALTASGRILYRQAALLLDHARRVEFVMRGVAAGERGNLLLGCVPSAMYSILPKVMMQYRQRHPDIHLSLKEGYTHELMEDVADGRLDLGLLWGNARHPRLDVLPIMRKEFCAALPPDHPLSRRAMLSLDDLAGEPLILPPREVSPYHHDHIIHAFASRGHNPRIAYEVPTVLSQIGFVAAGFGIAIIPSLMRSFAASTVAVLPLQEPIAPVFLTMVWNAERDSRASRQFRAVLQDIHSNAI
jgi:DNA-binding transcriptional LysR family regulator